ncbi:glycosyltransferase [Paenibacillus kobensis]|uniref:glycosyltransferase n=1 Tax=Paenibacillus kobensis TaxID=59841 RepID=UPI000FDC68DE|nr:glycosyltransferase [Paenibacillus kobensis]
MRVAVMTMFNGLSKTYSLVSVVEEQLHMLLNAGHDVKLLVCEDCPHSERYGIYLDERLQWVPVTNRYAGEQIHWRDYSHATGQLHPAFFGEADAIARHLQEILQDVEVCVLHDILYQGWHLVHNVALRQAQAGLPHVRFVAYTHSLPAASCPYASWPFSARYTPLPNTTYVYPTSSGLAALARQYGAATTDCRAVPNSINLLAEASGPLKSLAGATDLLSPDILAVYPGRLTTGKQFEKAAALAGAVRSVSGLSVKLVCCDFPSMDIAPDEYKERIRHAGSALGLEEDGLVFTSDCGWPDGFPHQAVMELFGLSNLFLCPSYSESFGLIVLEAASRGNLLVLNEAVPALAELGDRLGAYFMRWDARGYGFDTTEHYHPSEQAYLQEHAARIVQRLADNPVLRAKTAVRRDYNPQSVWERHLRPIVEGR